MKSTTPSVCSGRAAQRWLPHVEAQRDSGLTVRAFAAKHGLCAASLYVWRRRLRGTSTRSITAASPGPRLVPITLAVSTLCELVLRSGRVLRFDPALDLETVQRLVRAAEAP